MNKNLSTKAEESGSKPFVHPPPACPPPVYTAFSHPEEQPLKLQEWCVPLTAFAIRPSSPGRGRRWRPRSPVHALPAGAQESLRPKALSAQAHWRLRPTAPPLRARKTRSGFPSRRDGSGRRRRASPRMRPRPARSEPEAELAAGPAWPGRRHRRPSWLPRRGGERGKKL